MPVHPNGRDTWPITRVDKMDKFNNRKSPEHTIVETLNVPTTYCQNNQNPKKKASFLYQPDAYDEMMYATYLTQKVVFTREYPYAKSVQVLARKDWVDDPDVKPIRKPSPKLTIASLLFCLPLGLFVLLHFMRALSAYVWNSN